jgi:hypothetical protein
MFNLRSGLKAEWIDTDLPDNTAGWRSKWFYIADKIPGLPQRTGHEPVKMSEWDLVSDKGGPGASQRYEEPRSDRRGGGEVVLPADDLADQGSGPPGV